MGIINKYKVIQMGLRDFIQPGRVCFVNYGEDYGKLVVVVDFVDYTRVLIDSANGSFPRVVYPLARLTCTKLCLPVLRGARTGTIVKAAKKFDLDAKWKKTTVCQKMDRFAKRKSLNDYERFQVMVKRSQRSYLVQRLTAKFMGKKPAGKGKAAPAKAPAKKEKAPKEKKAKK